jgi:hypothetical protein
MSAIRTATQQGIDPIEHGDLRPPDQGESGGDPLLESAR